MGKSHQQCPENKDGSSEAQKWFSTNATLPEKECPRKERVFTTGDCRTQKNQPTQPQQQCIQNQHWTSIPRQQKSRWGAWENQDRGLAPDDMAQVSFFLLISLSKTQSFVGAPCPYSPFSGHKENKPARETWTQSVTLSTELLHLWSSQRHLLHLSSINQ